MKNFEIALNSEELQLELLKEGYNWPSGEGVKNLDAKYLYIEYPRLLRGDIDSTVESCIKDGTHTWRENKITIEEF